MRSPKRLIEPREKSMASVGASEEKLGKVSLTGPFEDQK